MKKQVVVALFAISFLFALSVVSAETVLESWTSGLNSDAVSNFFSYSFFNPTDGALKFLIFFLVAVIVLGVAPFIPFLNTNKFVTWLVSLIVAYFATFAITYEEVRLILVSYGALGILLTGILPFFVIAAISKRSYEQGNYFFSRLLWVLFFALTFYRLLTAPADQISDATKGAFYVLLALTAFMFFAEKWIYMRMFKEMMQGNVDKSKQLLAAKITADIENLDEKIATADDKTAAKLEERKTALIAKLHDLR